MKAQTKRQFLFFPPCVFTRGNKMQESDAIDWNADTIKGIGLYPSCICKKKGRVACCQTPQLSENKRKVISNLISALFVRPFVLCQLKHTKYHTEKSHISLSHLLLEFMDTLSLHLKSASGHQLTPTCKIFGFPSHFGRAQEAKERFVARVSWGEHCSLLS